MEELAQKGWVHMIMYLKRNCAFTARSRSGYITAFHKVEEREKLKVIYKLPIRESQWSVFG
jgi:hypothetical protein